MTIRNRDNLAPLRKAFAAGNLTLYLGAGVSKDNGLPSWEELVQALYFRTLGDEFYISRLKPFPNYLFALAEWVLKQKNEPLDIIIRKIKQWYPREQFMRMLSETLYAGFGRENFAIDISETNPTLYAIAHCCRQSMPGKQGLKSIITYNYDNLLELSLEHYAGTLDNFQPVYKGSQQLELGKIPIYHVHGYVPYQNCEVNYEDILFSEDQYNRAFQDPFYWGNVIQVNQLTNATGLFIGLSLTDRNIRRILDSIKNQPVLRNNYILVCKPDFKIIQDNSCELKQIREKASEYRGRFANSRMKRPRVEFNQIQNILDEIYKYETDEYDKGFKDLGLKVISFDHYNEIPEILREIVKG